MILFKSVWHCSRNDLNSREKINYLPYPFIEWFNYTWDREFNFGIAIDDDVFVLLAGLEECLMISIKSSPSFRHLPMLSALFLTHSLRSKINNIINVVFMEKRRGWSKGLFNLHEKNNTLFIKYTVTSLWL